MHAHEEDVEEILRRAEMDESDEPEDEALIAGADDGRHKPNLDLPAIEADVAEDANIEDSDVEDGELKEEIAAAKEALTQTGKRNISAFSQRSRKVPLFKLTRPQRRVRLTARLQFARFQRRRCRSPQAIQTRIRPSHLGEQKVCSSPIALGLTNTLSRWLFTAPLCPHL